MTEEIRKSATEAPTMVESIDALRHELQRLNDHRFIRVQNSWWRLLAFQFFRGLALGLGTVVGATILVSILGFALAQVDFIPILGDWANEIARQIEQAN